MTTLFDASKNFGPSSPLNFYTISKKNVQPKNEFPFFKKTLHNEASVRTVGQAPGFQHKLHVRAMTFLRDRPVSRDLQVALQFPKLRQCLNCANFRWTDAMVPTRWRNSARATFGRVVRVVVSLRGSQVVIFWS